MARNKGQFVFAANFEVKAQAALDPRMVVTSKAELLSKETWPYDGDTAYIYNGLVVAVVEEQALYMLIDKDNYSAEDYSAWKCLEAEPAAVVEVIDNLTSTDTDKALSANQGKILKDAIDNISYSIKKLDTAEGDNSSSYQLIGKDGTVFGDTINIPKDLVVSSGSVKVVEADGAPYAEAKIGDLYIQLDLANSGDSLYIPANKLVDEYTAGDYIEITDRQISVNYANLSAAIKTDLVDSVDKRVTALETTIGDSEKGLTANIAANAAAIKANSDAIAVLDKTVQGIDGEVAANAAVISGIEERVVEVEKQLNEETEGTLANKVANLSGKLDEYKVKDINTASSNGISLSLDENGLISVTANLTSDKVITNAAVGSLEAGSSVQTVLENLDSRIKAAVSGGVTAVAAGFGIAVDASDANNPSVSVKIKEGSAIAADANGLDIYWTVIENN